MMYIVIDIYNAFKALYLSYIHVIILSKGIGVRHMDNFQKQLGTRLRNIRIAKNYSIEELSHKAELHPAHLGKIERGEQNFTINTLNKIVEALGVPYEQIFDFEQELTPSANPFIEKLYPIYLQ